MSIPVLLLFETVAFVLGLCLVQLRNRPVAGQRDPALIAIAVASGLAAAMSSGSPTGWSISDVLVKACLGFALVWLARNVPIRVIVVLALLATLAPIQAPGFPLGAIALGVALAGMVVPRPRSLNGAVAVAGIVQVALRLTLPAFQGASALAALVFLAPIVVLGLRALPASLRTHVRKGAIGVALLAAASTVLVSASTLAARASLSRAVRLLDASAVVGPQSKDSDVARQLKAAHRDFSTASALLGGWWNRPAALVPVLSQHWRLLAAAAKTGKDLSDVASRAASAPAIENIQVLEGQLPLDQLRELQPIVDEAARTLEAAESRLRASRSTWLLPPVSHRLEKELRRITGATVTASAASRALPLVPGLLGADGPRRYFLAIQTPAELRGSGGIIGNYGEIEADQGRLRLTRFGRLFDLKVEGTDKDQRVLVAPPDYVARYSRFAPEREWLNVNLSPDFPTDAQVIAGLYPQSGGQPIDGVIAVDPFGLAALLKVIGPVQSPNWPEPITDANAAQILLYDQYNAFDLPERVDFLGDIAEEVWRRVTQGSTPGLREVLIALAPAASNKRIMIQSTHPAEQQMLEAVGISGRMPPVDGDFLGVVNQNAGGNKLDAYLHRSVDYRVELSPSSKKITSTATITLKNDAPVDGLPAYVGNNLLAPGLPPNHNKAYLSVYSPWSLSGARIDGAPVTMESEDELGRRVYSVGVVIPPQKSVTVALDFAGTLSSDHGYRLDLFRQPTVAPDDVHTSVAVRGRWAVEGGRNWDRDLQLSGDVVMQLGIKPSF
ncbi:MAG: DUF4012 domain-containing protein [Acidimicrobiales bacterium]